MKNNVLFGNQQVLELMQINTLTSGDAIEIGSRGINMSGGRGSHCVPCTVQQGQRRDSL